MWEMGIDVIIYGKERGREMRSMCCVGRSNSPQWGQTYNSSCRTGRLDLGKELYVSDAISSEARR